MDRPNPGFPDYVKSPNIIVPWAERQTFLREDSNWETLERACIDWPDREHPTTRAITQVLDATGELDLWIDNRGGLSGPADCLSRLGERVGFQFPTEPPSFNALSLMVSTIGTDVPSPVERLAVVHEAMVGAKRLHDAIGPDVLTDWLAVASPLLLSGAARAYLGLRLARRAPVAANLFISDVPGPPVPSYFGGARLLGGFIHSDRSTTVSVST